MKISRFFVACMSLHRAIGPLYFATLLFIHAVDAHGADSRWVRVGQSGRLIYTLDDRGDRLMDFSMVGYAEGMAPLPTYSEVVTPDRIFTVNPIAGDNRTHIQAKINEIAALSLANGFRGVVQLPPGNYEISGPLLINSSGIILRGAGDGPDPATNTILTYTGTSQTDNMIQVSGTLANGSPTHKIIDKVVPVGATSFRVDSNWNVGDTIVLRRPSPQNWIDAIGMNPQWQPGTKNQNYERTITYIDQARQRVFLDAPLPNSFEQKYDDDDGGAFKITRNRTNNVGIENIRGNGRAGLTTSVAANSFVVMQNTSNGWVRNVTGQRLFYATVEIGTGSRNVTVDDATSIEPVSQMTGSSYPFNIEGQFSLMKNLVSDQGRHDFVNDSPSRGPNVFIDGNATRSRSDSGPHQSWATGTLFDSLRTAHDINVRNRSETDPDHGWAGANMVIWNSQARSFIVQNPPTAQNWLIGSTGAYADDPTYPAYDDSHGSPVTLGTETSLYRAQLNERMAHQREQRREYWLGDFDGYENGDVDDQPEVDPQWRAAAQALMPTATITGFDGVLTASNVIVPFTFNFDPPSGRISSATLSLAVHGGGSQPANDRIWIESTANSIAFDQLHIEQFTNSEIVTIEFLSAAPGATLEFLDDGQLNVLVGNDHAVDWADLVFTTGSKVLTWTGTTNGDWDVIATQNWRDGAMPEQFYNGDSVIFGDGPLNRTINLTGTVLPAAVTVNNSVTNDYTFVGVGVIGGSASLTKQGAGTLTVNHVRAGTLSVSAGAVVIAPHGGNSGTSVVNTLSVTGPSRLDLNNNDLVVRGTSATKDAIHGAIEDDIVTAQNGVDVNLVTKWDGPGITSSTARAANVAQGFDLIGLGVIRNSDLDVTTGIPNSSYTSFSGQAVTPDDVLVKYTYIGDANLSGAVTFDDYVGMDNAFFGLIPNLGWATGDINFDGVINFDDYSKVDQAFFFQGAPLSGEIEAAAVPEPGTWLLALSCGLAVLLAYANKLRLLRVPS